MDGDRCTGYSVLTRGGAVRLVAGQGEVAVTANYQSLVADRHLFSNLTGPELTPMEIAVGTDFQSNSLDLGKCNLTQSSWTAV